MRWVCIGVVLCASQAFGQAIVEQVKSDGPDAVRQPVADGAVDSGNQTEKRESISDSSKPVDHEMPSACDPVVPENDTADRDVSASDGPTETDFLEQYRDKAIERWEDDIVKLEQRDIAEEYHADSILFVGSSSIRRWESIARDMAPYRVIQRGYGGAKYSDVAVYAERLLQPHSYRALVVFVGNDVSGKKDDHTPDQVEQLVRHLIAVSQSHQPDAPVLLIEVTPTEKRFAVWPQIRAVNARIRDIALTSANTYCVMTAEYFLDPMGCPRTHLFVDDKLHLNDDGYELWARLIRRQLDDVLRMVHEFHAKE